MVAKRQSTAERQDAAWYRGRDVSMAVIRRFARQVAERFQPDKIILFGSHAYGTPHADSDVDILIIMPCRNQHDQAFRIRMATPAPFPMDLLVRKPSEIKWRLEEGELFHSEILRKGKVLYEKGNARVGAQSRSGLSTRGKTRKRKRGVL